MRSLPDKPKDDVIKILYSGEWNDVVTNLKPMPDGRGIMETYSPKNKIHY